MKLTAPAENKPITTTAAAFTSIRSSIIANGDQVAGLVDAVLNATSYAKPVDVIRVASRSFASKLSICKGVGGSEFEALVTSQAVDIDISKNVLYRSRPEDGELKSQSAQSVGKQERGFKKGGFFFL